jgi:hypothetical protein
MTEESYRKYMMKNWRKKRSSSKKKFPKESRSSSVNRSISRFSKRLLMQITDKSSRNGTTNFHLYGSARLKRMTTSLNSWKRLSSLTQMVKQISISKFRTISIKTINTCNFKRRIKQWLRWIISKRIPI